MGNTQCPSGQTVEGMGDAQGLGPHLGGLQGHFDPALQDSSREARAGHGGEPEAEVLMAGVRADALHNALQAGHPADCQVAVLQADPLPLLHAGYQHFLSLHTHCKVYVMVMVVVMYVMVIVNNHLSLAQSVLFLSSLHKWYDCHDHAHLHLIQHVYYRKAEVLSQTNRL